MEPDQNEPQEPAAQREKRLMMAAEAMKAELCRHYLSERQRIVADQVVAITLGLGRERIRIPKLEVLSDLTGLARSHVCTALKALDDMRIVFTKHKNSAFELTMNLEVERWKVRWRVASDTRLRGLDVVREFNHLPSAGADGGPQNFKGEDPAQTLLALVTTPVTVSEFPDELCR